ncbi:MAG: S41 family peptidase [Paramuribaculum sp.]|nr:S41 family peptidase [Paramuribaculum sp.]MDE7451993.1 S41 family peptidase [Paramuribaculum sp.]
MKSNKKLAVWMPVIVAVAFVIGLYIGANLFKNGPEWNTRVKIGEIMDLISDQYVDEVNTDSILEASIPDILAKLDPHTVYIPASELQGTNEALDGSFGGIGVVFTMMNDTATVMEVVSGGPAEKVGVLAGDRIVTVNDSIVAGIKLDSESLRKKLKGPKGSSVLIGIKRSNSSELLSFDVVRGDIPVNAVDASYMIRPGIGYIRINKFGRTTYMEFMNAMVSLRAEGARKIILDLRGNTGGYMEPAILMANEFLGVGMPIVSTHGRTGNIESDFSGDGQGAFGDTELVVVIDEGSASASEIFAGAIQDNDRGLIVGRRSFGKGLVQRQIELPDSSAIRLTTARYYTPSGRCIQKPYTLGSAEDYELEIYTRFDKGEGFSADSIKVDTTKIYSTASGRTVYGGGGIMPDVYVASDTAGITPYYIKVFNAGMLHRYAFLFTDINRDALTSATSVLELMDMLPQDEILLNEFIEFARTEGNIPPRWYYINISRDLIVRQLKSLIASDVLGQPALFEVSNEGDPAIMRAIQELKQGNAVAPITGKPQK